LSYAQQPVPEQAKERLTMAVWSDPAGSAPLAEAAPAFSPALLAISVTAPSYLIVITNERHTNSGYQLAVSTLVDRAPVRPDDGSDGTHGSVGSTAAAPSAPSDGPTRPPPSRSSTPNGPSTASTGAAPDGAQPGGSPASTDPDFSPRGIVAAVDSAPSRRAPAAAGATRPRRAPAQPSPLALWVWLGALPAAMFAGQRTLFRRGAIGLQPPRRPAGPATSSAQG
jgi:hypothetical protein